MSSSSTSAVVDVAMPQMGTSISEATVIEWHKAVGDVVVRDEPLCDIATDKVDSDCPAPVGGTLAEILVAAGETVDVGTVIARIASDAAPPSPPAPPPPTPTNPPTNGRDPGRRYSPVVRRMAEALGLDLAAVPGTGRGGRVTKKDVEEHLARPAEPQLHSESPYRRPDATVEPSGASSAEQPRIRQLIGAAMRRSLETAATCTTVVECDMSDVERRRGELGLTALPLVARATIETLRDYPNLNATLDGTTFTAYAGVDLGIAVSLGDAGLIVPVIRGAHLLSEEGLATRIRDLAGRARAGELTADEIGGATFTITNPGAYGALIATPIIDLPQVAILDLEAIVRRPVVVRDPAGNESIGIRPMVNLCMSWDHRAIDGVYAAQFLSALRRRLEGEGA